MSLRLLLCLVLLHLSGIPAHAGHTLRFATEGSYPPFSYIDESGELAGFDVDISLALCKTMEVRCTMTHRPWEDLIPGLLRGEYDVIVACMARIAEREKVVDFTGHYFRSKTGFIGKATAAVSISPEGLAGKVLASQRGTVQGEFLRKRYPSSAVMLYPTMGEAFAALAPGEADLVLAPMLAGLEFLKSPDGKNFDFVGSALSQEEYPDTPAHIVVRKDETALRKQLDDALQDIRINGCYDQINRKYFPFSVY